ncbi:MAG: PH domain-containing protein [Planctomycetota bacterium]
MSDDKSAPDSCVPLFPLRLDAQSVIEPAAPIFAGSVSLWLGVRTFLFAGLLLILSLAFAIYGALNQRDNLGYAALIVGGALFLATALMVSYIIISLKTMRYTITHRLIEREQGVIFKRVDSLDLGRVKDVKLMQSLFDRLVNIGAIIIYTSDKTDPILRIEAIPNPRPVYEQLRDAVIEIGRNRGIVAM